MTQNNALLHKVQAVVSDMDGVFWRGNKPMPGLGDFFAFLRERKLPFILATNNSTRSAAEYAAKLDEMGVQVSEKEILPSCDVVADYLTTIAPPATRIFIVGAQALADAIAGRGFVISDGEADIVVAGLDRQITYAKLSHASTLIRRGARFIGTNPDKTWPGEAGEVPGAGAVLAFIQASTDVEPLIVAKPEPIMFEQALKRLGVQPQEAIMIGDRLDTDIAGGLRAGLLTALVLSGVSTRADIDRLGVRPDLVFDNIGEMIQVWKTVA